MITITATAESLKQAEQLINTGIDTLYIGEEHFGLRLPTSFTREEQKRLVEMAHEKGKKVTVAVNAMMHPEKMKEVPAYLTFLKEIKVDQITVGDTGVIYLLKKGSYGIPYIYDGETLVTSSRQINFWGKKGAVGAVLAREIPYMELVSMAPNLDVFGEVLVYGATCIHQSLRPLLQNYLSYVGVEDQVSKARGFFLSEPKKEDTHYSIYEDTHGTHIFANNDVNLTLELDKLVALSSYNHWKLDGIFTPGETFVDIAKCFVEIKEAFAANLVTTEYLEEMNQKVVKLHPKMRGLDTGFLLLNPEDVK
ncbi:peptidase U32 family protein [Vagococcus entomophilus]|uniref:Peptidase U32 n=1 Tax=Vagococcus entomophilus TaxID=1160095 RepID=A0A430AFY9_9ENTE|nr:peptidase U32 family protein [Vagococcus entomophilus]RSU06641.1 peptidase U32 [Vagococcus entomophilus]